MSVYLYTPPSWRNPAPMGGALVVGVRTSTCVYRVGGVWHNQMNAGMDNPVMANVDVIDIPGAGSLRLFFTKPMVVPGSLHDELAAISPADPSWTPGSLTLL